MRVASDHAAGADRLAVALGPGGVVPAVQEREEDGAVDVVVGEGAVGGLDVRRSFDDRDAARAVLGDGDAAGARGGGADVVGAGAR